MFHRIFFEKPVSEKYIYSSFLLLERGMVCLGCPDAFLLFVSITQTMARYPLIQNSSLNFTY